MEFFEAVKVRRSIRKYLPTPVPNEVVDKALDAALIAPNSSNLQTWGFYWVKTPERKQKLVEACLNQNAARTSQHLVVVVADLYKWRQTQAEMMRRIEATNGPAIMKQYYGKLIPFVYGMWLLSPFKWLFYNIQGFFKPVPRTPWRLGNLQEVSIKSAALASENFMLAISAQGYDTCPMEGFDECRVKRLLGLRWTSRVVMVISVGKRDDKGVWGPQVRFNREWFVHDV